MYSSPAERSSASVTGHLAASRPEYVYCVPISCKHVAQPMQPQGCMSADIPAVGCPQDNADGHRYIERVLGAVLWYLEREIRGVHHFLGYS